MKNSLLHPSEKDTTLEVVDTALNVFLKKLVVELDGGQHAEQGRYDEKRTLFLQSKDYTVLRFWNNEIFKETEAVLSEILYNINKDG